MIGAVLALVGRSRLQKVRGPERAIAQVEATKEALTRQTEAHAQAEIDRAIGSA